MRRTVIKLFSEAQSGSKNIWKTVREQRKVHEDKLTALRKIWQKELIDAREQKINKEKIELDDRVLKRAVKLREKRKISAEKQEAARQFRAKMLEIYRANLERSHVREEGRIYNQNNLNKEFLKELQLESSKWIKQSTVDEQITEKLFEKPSTTGVITPHSNHWRWIIHSGNYGGTFNYPDTSYYETEGQDISKVEESLRGQAELFVEDMMRQMLDEIIDKGKDRERFDNYVETFQKTYLNNYVPTDTNDPVNQLMSYWKQLQRKEEILGDMTVVPPPDYNSEEDKEKASETRGSKAKKGKDRR